MSPSDRWHPADPANRVDRYAPKQPTNDKVKVNVTMTSSQLFPVDPPLYSVIKEGLPQQYPLQKVDMLGKSVSTDGDRKWYDNPACEADDEKETSVESEKSEETIIKTHHL